MNPLDYQKSKAKLLVKKTEKTFKSREKGFN